MPKQRRPVRSAAITVVPLPRKPSSTMSPRAEQSRIASATSATGFTVGCKADRLPSSLLRPKELPPGYRQILLRLRPKRPSWTLLRCSWRPCLKTKTSSVLTAIQRAHPGIVLDPDAEVLDFAVDPVGGGEQL